MDTEKPCHKRPEPNVAGGKVVVDSFSENEEVAMLDNEIGGGKITPVMWLLYVVLRDFIDQRLVSDDAKIATIMLIAKLFCLFLSFHHNI